MLVRPENKRKPVGQATDRVQKNWDGMGRAQRKWDGAERAQNKWEWDGTGRKRILFWLPWIKDKKFGPQIFRMLLQAKKKHGVGARIPECEISLKTNTAVSFMLLPFLSVLFGENKVYGKLVILINQKCTR